MANRLEKRSKNKLELKVKNWELVFKLKIFQVLIFFLFFLLPAGWSKHWLISQSLVSGVLVDYLMPAIWIQDLAILLFIIAYFLLNLKHKIRNSKQYLSSNLQNSKQRRLGHLNFKDRGLFQYSNFRFGILLIFLSVFFSFAPIVSFVYTGRFFLAVTGGFLLIKLFKENKSYKKVALKGLAGAAIWTGVLAILQFAKQKTVFGWWFLGEPIFNPGYTGVKRVEMFNNIFVAPMATFSHSNILAAFALLSLIVLWGYQKSLLTRLAIGFSLVSLAFSFSVYTWGVGALLLSLKFRVKSFKLSTKSKVQKIDNYGLLTKLIARARDHGLIILGAFVFCALCYLFVRYPLFTTYYSSFSRRFDLAKISLSMIKDYPLFGVGWGCFAAKIPDYWQKLAITSRFLQPVHNVFLLALSEMGLVGTLGIVLLFLGLFKKMNLFMPRTSYFVFLFLLFLFDHYFWTTAQGIYMLAIMTALFFTETRRQF